MDFISVISEISEASKIIGEGVKGFSEEALSKLERLFEDDKLNSSMEENDSTNMLDTKEIEEKFDKLFELDDSSVKLDINEEKIDNTENNTETKKENDDVEEQELTTEQINEKQKDAIKDAFKRILKGEKLTDAEKGNLGEMLMDQYYISKGYTPIHSPRVTDLESKAPRGIDGVYEKINLDGTKSYVIADAKVNQSQLSKGLADGTNQMSNEWIDKRLDDAVGKEKADEIRDSYEDDPSSVSREVYHYSYGESADGSSSADIFTVDEDGNSNRDKEVVQVFDENGNIIESRTRGERDD